MYKIAILGCENSHAKNFLELISAGKYPEIEVVGVYSEEIEAAQKLHDTFGVSILNDYADLQGQVDGIMITARHGDNHYRYAKPYLNDGIPMFIDKPITCLEDEAVEFMCAAKQKKVRLCGGSTCAALKETLELAESVRQKKVGDVKSGYVIAPILPENPHGGFYFYAQHLVEIMTTIFGENISEICATRQGDLFTYLARYDGYDVTGAYVKRLPYYFAAVGGEKEIEAKTLTFTPSSFEHEMNDMLDLLHGKEMKKSYESFITPVFVINAILRSLESGKWEQINPIVI